MRHTYKKNKDLDKINESKYLRRFFLYNAIAIMCTQITRTTTATTNNKNSNQKIR